MRSRVSWADDAKGLLAGWTPHVVTAVAVVLGWQILLQPVTERAPPEMAIKVAPTSPLVLSRAAETELQQGQIGNAAALARESLARAPFDVRALRVLGLAEAKAGRADNADALLTLAGNWSLRDDPSHAWLVERRLRQGSYASSFAHADTLLRRREDVWPMMFRLFTMAAVSDPDRATPVIANLLEAGPPWRRHYLNSLYKSPDGLEVAMILSVALERSNRPLDATELYHLYFALLRARQFGAVDSLRHQLDRPSSSTLVTNGYFDDRSAPRPFQWGLAQKAGALAEIMASDSAPPNQALWVQYDGYTAADLAKQLTFLRPGRYRLRAAYRIAEGRPAERLFWRIRCANRPAPPLHSTPAVPQEPAASNSWGFITSDFSVPPGCAGPWLALEGSPLDYRSRMVVWFDQISLSPASDADSH